MLPYKNIYIHRFCSLLIVDENFVISQSFVIHFNMEFYLNTSPISDGDHDRVDSWKISGCPIYDLKDNCNPLFESPFSTLGPFDPFPSNQQVLVTTPQYATMPPLIPNPTLMSSNFSNSNLSEAFTFSAQNATPTPLPTLKLPTVPWELGSLPPDLPSHVYTSLSRYYPPTIRPPRKLHSKTASKKRREKERKEKREPKKRKSPITYQKYRKVSEEREKSLKNDDKHLHSHLKKKRASIFKNSHAARVSHADHILKILLHFYLAGHTATSIGQKAQQLLKSYFYQFHNPLYFPTPNPLISRPASV